MDFMSGLLIVTLDITGIRFFFPFIPEHEKNRKSKPAWRLVICAKHKLVRGGGKWVREEGIGVLMLIPGCLM